MGRRKPHRHEKSSSVEGRPGRVVSIKGRRVVVADEEGVRTCFLSGQRAVVGDRVLWVEARGEGGKLVDVLERDTVLRRVDFHGREQVLAANVGGLLIVTAPKEPPFRPGLIDRYVVAAAEAGLDAAVFVNKMDQGLEPADEAELALRQDYGVPVFRGSAHEGDGIDDLKQFLSEQASDRPWVFVGHSGVGKTSLLAVLLPEQDVGAVGEVSAYWGTGQHTTTGSRLFHLPSGGALVDSPGIRTFSPGGMTSETVRAYFPGMEEVVCKYRNCLHRPGEEGCTAEEQVRLELVESYRRLLSEVLDREERERQRR